MTISAGHPSATVNGYVEVTGQSTTNGTFEDISGATFDITIPSSGRIKAKMIIGSSTTGGSPAVGSWCVNIAGVDHREIPRALSGTTDAGNGIVGGRSDPLAPGTYTVKGRHRRVSGAVTVNTDVAKLDADFVAV